MKRKSALKIFSTVLSAVFVIQSVSLPSFVHAEEIYKILMVNVLYPRHNNVAEGEHGYENYHFSFIDDELINDGACYGPGYDGVEFTADTTVNELLTQANIDTPDECPITELTDNPGEIVGGKFLGWYVDDYDTPITGNTKIKDITDAVGYVPEDDGIIYEYLDIKAKYVIDIDASLSNISVLRGKDEENNLIDANIGLKKDGADVTESDFEADALDASDTAPRNFSADVSGGVDKLDIEFTMREPYAKELKIEYTNNGTDYTPIEYSMPEKFAVTDKGTTVNNEGEVAPEDWDRVYGDLHNGRYQSEGDDVFEPNYTYIFKTHEMTCYDCRTKSHDEYFKTSQTVFVNNIPVSGSGSDSIRITVTPENETDGHAMEYNIAVDGKKPQIKLNYANSLYGRIMQQSEEQRNAAIDLFGKKGDKNSQHMLSVGGTGSRRYHTPDAWKAMPGNPDDEREIFDGYITRDYEYINYDKDAYAIIAFLGSDFLDSGVSLLDKDGNNVEISNSNPVKRTIKYNIVGEDGTLQEKTEEQTITSSAELDEYIECFKNYKYRINPGIYSIEYESAIDGLTAKAVRNIVLLPKLGDANMDNYINSLDANVYDDDTFLGMTGTSLSLYKLRALNLDFDSDVDEDDANRIYQRTDTPDLAFGAWYGNSGRTVEVQRKKYSYPSSPSADKAQIYMDYLEKDPGGNFVKNDNPGVISAGAEFYLGLRAENLEKAGGIFNDGIYSMTLSIDYDSDTVTFANGENSDWKTLMTENNSGWSGYTFTPYAASNKSYSTTVDSTRNNNSDIFVEKSLSTMVYDIKAKDLPESSYRRLNNGDYLAIIPIKLKTDIPMDDRSIFAMALGAQTFSMSFGEKGKKQGAMWNTWDDNENPGYSLNGVSKNLNGIFEYMGDFVPNGNDEIPEIKDIEVEQGKEATYGVDFFKNDSEWKDKECRGISQDKLSKLDGIEEGTIGRLPDGLEFESAYGNIVGAPHEVGKFCFYIGSILYKMTVYKKDVKVYPAEYDTDKNCLQYGNLTREYGNSDPTISTYYDGLCFDESAYTDNPDKQIAGLNTPVWQHETISETADVGTSTDITCQDGGSATNYNFIPQTGCTLTVKRRVITVSSVTKDVVPVITSLMAKNGQWNHRQVYTNDSPEITVENVYANDKVSIAIDSNYTTYEPGENIEVVIKLSLTDDGRYKNKNYELLTDSITTNYGEIKEAKVTQIVNLSPPQTSYTYGDSFLFSTGKIRLSYDNETVEEIGYDQLAEKHLKMYINSDYLENDTNAEVIDENYVMTMGNSNQQVRVVYDKDPTKYILIDKRIIVIPRTVTITARNKSHIYGETIDPDSIKDEYDIVGFVDGESVEDLDAKPVVTCTGEEDLSVGEHNVLKASGAVSSKYRFVYVDGTLTTKPRKINITGITKPEAIPPLTGDIYKNNDGSIKPKPWAKLNGAATASAADGVLDTETSQATITGVASEPSGLYRNDSIKIKYDVEYTTHEVIGTASYIPVNLSNFTIDKSFGKGANYELVTDTSTVKSAEFGVVQADKIIDFWISKQPKTDYIYGEPLDLSNLEVTVQYNTLQEIPYNEQQLKEKFNDLGISIIYDRYRTEAKSGEVLPFTHTGRQIQLEGNVYNNASSSKKTVAFEKTLNIAKRDMHVRTNDKEIYYGNSPDVTYTYDSADFQYGESARDSRFLNELTAPVIKLQKTGEPEGKKYDQTERIPAGTYNIIIENGEAANYNFVPDEKTLTVKKRPLYVRGLSKIPVLTAELSKDGASTHTIKGYADNDANADNNLTLSNLAWSDELIRISYDATYRGNEPTEDVIVGVGNYAFDDNAPSAYSNANYEIQADGSITSTSGGRVEANEITAVEIVEEPKLTGYEYGQPFDMNSGKITVRYTGNYADENLTLADLPSSIKITAEAEGKDSLEINSQTQMHVSDTGRKITLTPTSVIGDVNYAAEAVSTTGTLEIAKKELHVTAENKSFVYGDSPAAMTSVYTQADYVYGDTDAVVKGEEVYTCEAANTSDIGEYTISVSGVDADDYKIVPVDGIMTITRRPIHISSINSGLPELKSSQMYDERFTDMHIVPGKAVNENMTFTKSGEAGVAASSGLVNDDEIGAAYEAIYSNAFYSDVEQIKDNVTVRIRNICLDETVGKTKNYILEGDLDIDTSNNGKINPKKLSAVEIQENGQPKLDYHYGDKLDLSANGLTIVYDSGETVPNVAYSDIGNYGLAMKYTDTSEPASEGDILTPKTHNSDSLTIYSPTDDAVEETITEALSVEKHILKLKADNIVMTYGNSILSDVVYDENGLQTEGTADYALTYSYDKTKLINGDTAIEGLKNVALKCYNDGSPIGETTFANGSGYTVEISGAESDNYSFVYETGRVYINRRQIDVASVELPDITSKALYADYRAGKNVHEETMTASNKEAEGKCLAGITNSVNDDEIGFTFKININAAYYQLMETADFKAKLSEITLDDVSAVNYVLISDADTSKQLKVLTDDNTFAKVHKREISDVEIINAPDFSQYNYGDKFNADELKVSITYDSGEKAENMSYTNLVTESIYRDITLQREDGKAVKTGDDISCDTEGGNGQTIYLVAKSDAANVEGGSIIKDLGKLIIKQRPLKIKADSKKSVYGNSIPIGLFTYIITDESGRRVQLYELKGKYTAPGFKCIDDTGSQVSAKTPVKDGGYEIEPYGAEADNYSFEYETAVMEIMPREVDITSLTLPDVTSEMLYNDYTEGKTSHIFEGAALNKPSDNKCVANITNTVNNDSVGFTFKADFDVVYPSHKKTDSVKAKLSQISLDENSSNNYVLISDADSGKKLSIIEKDNVSAIVHAREIANVEITSNLKLSNYNYGDKFDTSALTVKEIYDSGEVIENVKYNNAVKYMSLVSEDGSKINNNDILAEDDENKNGQHIYLVIPTDAHGVVGGEIRKDLGVLSIKKKTLKMKAENKQSVYGDDIPSDFFTYVITDSSGNKVDVSSLKNFRAPAIICNETDNVPVSGKTHTNTDGYAILISGASSDSCVFEYESGTLKIMPREIDVESVNLPRVTSKILYEDYLNGKTDHTMIAYAQNKAAENKNLASITNTVNDDTVGIKLKASYTADYAEITEQTEVKATISDVEIDKNIGNFNDYILKNTNPNPDGSRNELTVIKNDNSKITLNEKKVSGFEIADGHQPKTEYEYGDVLDLSEKGITLIYDSGETLNEIAYNEADKYDISLRWTDLDEEVKDGVVLDAARHDGKRIMLTAPYTENKVLTDAIKINPKTLEIKECKAEDIVYDGHTTKTKGTITLSGIIGNDEVNAQGEFDFEDALTGNNKTVNVTNIKLYGKDAHNYGLASDNTQTTASILKSGGSIPGGDIKAELTPKNAINITVPPLTEEQINNGIKYEFSVDGGETWSDSETFDNLELGHKYDVCVRTAANDNYNESETIKIADITSYAVKLNIVDLATKEKTDEVFTNINSFETSKDIIDLIGGTREIRNVYSDTDKKEFTYPLSVSGENTIVVSFKAGSKGDGGGGIANKPKPTPTPKVTPTPTPEAITPTPKPTVTPTPVPSQNIRKAYILGYEQEIKPDVYLTRAEAAKIFAVQYSDFDADKTYPVAYPDVEQHLWYYNYIGFASEKSIIKGYKDGNFAPESHVTRAEFAAIAARYLGINDSYKSPESLYSDVRPDAWYYGYIMNLSSQNIIKGYLDKTYHPEDNITKAEAITLINRITERNYEHSEIDKMVCPFIDLSKSHWAYYEIMIAANDLAID